MHSKPKRNAIRQLVILLCAVVLLASALYVGSWLANRSRIREKSDAYNQMYNPAQATDPPAGTVSTETPASTEPAGDLPEIVDRPLATPDSDTIVLALPTPPPVQESFSDLLEFNPETIGFLRIDDLITLPVVQRENDNEYYLTHSFEQTEAAEGTLFLDGMNRLVPEDDCLIVYGHNMHNGTMFGELDHYDEPDFLQAHPLVTFDTIYENRIYVPIAAFPASMDSDNASYFEVRQFLFDSETFDLFLNRLKSRSVLDIPVDAAYGDRLLLLVTCDYTTDNGRFILALRQLRDGETSDEVSALIAQSK